jgi:hypothetical protein
VGSRKQAKCHRAVAERLADANLSTPFQQPAGKGIGFYTGDDGFLYCDTQKIDDIRKQVIYPPHPLFKDSEKERLREALIFLKSVKRLIFLTCNPDSQLRLDLCRNFFKPPHCSACQYRPLWSVLARLTHSRMLFDVNLIPIL